VVRILESNGFSLQRKAMTKTRFYFSRLLEATRK
jgi:magnesium-protoporphyrin O-methyltransferase